MNISKTNLASLLPVPGGEGSGCAIDLRIKGGAVAKDLARELRKTYGNQVPVFSILDRRVQRLRDVYALGHRIYIEDPEKLLGKGWKLTPSHNAITIFTLQSRLGSPMQTLSFNLAKRETNLFSYQRGIVSSPGDQAITMDREGKITSKLLQML